MAPFTTHLVIGERLFTHLVEMFGSLDYGSFLAGSVLVDVHVFSKIEREKTHFADRFEKNGPFGFDKSCRNFVERFDDLLLRPWDKLTDNEQAFVLGYFCHLAADENWKQFDWDVYQEQGKYIWSDLPLSGDILLTVFNVESGNCYSDFSTVEMAFGSAPQMEMFSHVSYGEFQRAWEMLKIHLEQRSTLESFLEMQMRLGKSEDEIDGMREQYRAKENDAKILIDEIFGGIEARINSMVQQSLETARRYREIFET